MNNVPYICQAHEFHGLTDDQREVILKVVAKNKQIRERLEGGSDPDTYNPFGYDEEEETEFKVTLHNTKGRLSETSTFIGGASKGDPQASAGSGASGLAALNDGHKKQPKVVGGTSGILMALNMRDPSMSKSLGSRTGRGYPQYYTTGARSESIPDMDPAIKYSRFVDRHKSKSARHISKSNSQEENKSLNEMKKVTEDLAAWVSKTINTPVNLYPSLRQPSFVEPQINSEEISTSDFDILLNACKPSILETKPPVRLNVVHEANPPDSLLLSLRENLGLKIAQAKKKYNKATKIILDSTPEAIERSTPSVRQRRLNYGSWYLQPNQWSKFAKMEAAKKESENAPKQRAFRGIVQEKLDEITRHRAQEEQMLNQLFQQMQQQQQRQQSQAMPTVSTSSSGSVGLGSTEEVQTPASVLSSRRRSIQPMSAETEFPNDPAWAAKRGSALPAIGGRRKSVVLISDMAEDGQVAGDAAGSRGGRQKQRKPTMPLSQLALTEDE
ncbi:uncharacterized protein BJ171DRAFT_511109 [Polychytrium aggregatum]|uniref:uncharacterized protein n=1 Tax=Polychytrium aggregatum TaxID=110093 RepID=UPI0022FE5BB0|nr:uncharacterized protein BJ171DRAFT_511109 [Polychytrium aggregatum]KAI9203197.1 hypothetical protein BJ171DRAFT_511109 [Polychytrium aggregatum]